MSEVIDFNPLPPTRIEVTSDQKFPQETSNKKRTYRIRKEETQAQEAPSILTDNLNKNILAPPTNKKRTCDRAPRAPLSSSLTNNCVSQSPATIHEVDTNFFPSSIQAVLDGTKDISFLEFDELEGYIVTKKYVLSLNEINHLKCMITESVYNNELDKCYFMRDMLSECTRELDETRTIKADINGLINTLADHLIKQEAKMVAGTIFLH